MPLPERDFDRLEEVVGYRFKDSALLLLALRHKSALEGKEGPCNDKLEWLGDRVVGLFIADYLFHNYDKPRGWLSLMKSKWASEECLAQLARRIGLDRFIELGRGEERNGGREKDSILSSAFEALAGAIFVDSASYEVTKKVLEGIFFGEGGIEYALLSINYKGLLQRWCLQYCGSLPEYEVVAENADCGPYRVAVKIRGRVVALGEGKNKKKAEQEAARRAWEKIIGEENLTYDMFEDHNAPRL
ncbi:MAG: ribonuclease III [Candidatus Caldatribacteriaceae bacterium]